MFYQSVDSDTVTKLLQASKFINSSQNTGHRLRYTLEKSTTDKPLTGPLLPPFGDAGDLTQGLKFPGLGLNLEPCSFSLPES